MITGLPEIAPKLIVRATITKIENGFTVELELKAEAKTFIARNLDDVTTILNHFYPGDNQ